jgi:glycosyltransferase involved in cell wall biosynthesis
MDVSYACGQQRGMYGAIFFPEMNKPGILFLTSWSSDEPLMLSYVVPYLEMIRELRPVEPMFLVTWEKQSGGHSGNREQLNAALQALNITKVETPFMRFGMRALFGHMRSIWKLAALMRKHDIGTLHPFAPAAGAMALMVRMLCPARIVMDSWEPHADAMVETRAWRQHSLGFRVLSAMEKRIAKSADLLLATSVQMPDYARRKWGNVPGRVLHRPACVNFEVFNPQRWNRAELRQAQGIPDDAVVGICVSKLGDLYLDQELFDFFALTERSFGSRLKVILLTSTPREKAEVWARKAGLSPAVLTVKMVAHEDVPVWLAMADFAVNPQRPVPAKRYGTPVKDGEYWAMGLPLVILPEISDDSEVVAQEKAGIILRSCSPEDMMLAVNELRDFLQRYPAPAPHIRAVAEKYRSMEIARRVYAEVYPTCPDPGGSENA